MDKPFINRTLELSKFFAPVDIIIPFFGQYAKVTKLLESLFSYPKNIPYQVCLVDDASPNTTFGETLKGFRNTKYVRSNTRLGFGGALKLGFDNTSSPWVCFLNSDCIVKNPSWLVEMGNSLLSLKSQNVRMISARSNNPGEDERLKGENDVDLPQDIILSTGYLPLYCVMCHRELFKHIGGFIKPYPLGWYEDQELAFRMKKKGFKQAICAKSWIFHEGEGTFKELFKNPDAAKIIEKNYEQYLKDIKTI